MTASHRTAVTRPDASKPPPPPIESPETVLLAVTGMSPAILTETLWALAHEPEPVLPSRIVVVTTLEGRRRLEDTLFQPAPALGHLSPWDALRAALTHLGFDLSHRLRFGTTPDDLRVITAVDAPTGRTRELADIRSPEDNEAAADFLLDQVRAVVENPDTHLVVSIAGGRKTMGALLYACLTLAGRETDRLTHVLVNEPFESLPGFLFPGQPGGPLADREGRTHDPADARIELADVPFVPLRNLFPRQLGRKVGTFSRLVDSCREQVRHAVGENLRLTLETTRPEIDVDGHRLKLAPREHLVLLFLATRVRQEEPPFPAQKDALEALEVFRSDLVRAAPGADFSDWRHLDSLRVHLDDADVRKALSSLRQRLADAGPGFAALAGCLPQKGRFGLAVPRPLVFLR